VRSQKTPWPACRCRETGRRDRCACRLSAVCCLPVGCSPCGAEHRQRRAGWCPTFASLCVLSTTAAGSERRVAGSISSLRPAASVGSSSVFLLRPPLFLGTVPGETPPPALPTRQTDGLFAAAISRSPGEPATPCRQISPWCIPPAKVLSTWANCKSAIYGRALSLDCKAFRSMRPIELFPLEFRNIQTFTSFNLDE
jgi:hypothetical protein